MLFGMEILREDGTIYASPDTHFMHFTGKITFTTSTNNEWGKTYIDTGVPVSAAIMPFMRQVTLGPDGIGIGPLINYAGQWRIEVLSYLQQVIDLYIFSSVNPVPGDYGVAFYNETGEIIYSSDTCPLEVYPLGDIPYKNGLLSNLTFPHNVAVWPGPWGAEKAAGGVWFTVIPAAVGNTITPMSSYLDIYTKFGYAGNNAFRRNWQGSLIYINSDLYD
ncbi:hypothetical protein B2M27_09950 [Kluyvera intermedia]|uniref:Uncharacterized protein n=1 Tax=Kluyvera intermedia TaxID=61648 RepID=A0ABX3UGQ4_KLUIN|nr:hypothetical protein [Kluyvera intermedia]ORJ50587.1 hypothetical protein B2M27_09950 [Kluyvera intermedia]